MAMDAGVSPCTRAGALHSRLPAMSLLGICTT